jgi:hypothetical protein
VWFSYVCVDACIRIAVYALADRHVSMCALSEGWFVERHQSELPLLAIYSQIGYFSGVGLWAMLWLFQRF